MLVVSYLAEALISIHKKEIIHNDISLSNIMVNLEGHVKVIDFGLALYFG
jgi:serine/threonine protein kinase